MTKRLLLNVLVKVLGDYVEGLSEENLKVGVTSGKIELDNVKLKLAALEKLNLPVAIHQGSVTSIEVIIPWTSLGSSPVKISINGVYLLAGPLNLENLSPEELHARAMAIKQHKLQQIETAMDIKSQMAQAGGEKNDSSYIQSYTAKIIDNLEITLHDIHIRYEDTVTVPGTTFAAGITLDSFVVATTNSKWEIVFIERSKDKSQIIHKLASMSNLCLYWNASASPINGDWLTTMHNYIYTEKAPNFHDMEYILQPPNSLSVKIVHNEDKKAVPKIVATVESRNLSLQLDKLQYQQALFAVSSFSKMDSQHQRLLYRPLRLLKQQQQHTVKAKDWWQYAFKLITNNEHIFENKMQRCMLYCRYRRRYIKLITTSKSMNPQTNTLYTLSAQEQHEVNMIEKYLSIDALVIFYQIALQEAAKYNKLYKKSAAEKKSWWSWATSSAKDEDDISLEQIQHDFNEALEKEASETFTMDLALVSSATVRLANERKPVCQFDMAVEFSASVRAGGAVASFAMTDIVLEDQFTPNAVFPKLISVLHKSGAGKPLKIEFENKDGSSTIQVSALPLQICFNKLCIQQILSVITPPKTNAPPQLHPTSSSGQHVASGAKSDAEGGMRISFNADAPKIIIPEDCSKDVGFLLIDAGHIKVDGSLAPAGMTWDVSLTDINAAMPLSARDIGQFGEQMYLIKPFGIKVAVQNVDHSIANMTVGVEIVPYIRGELDAYKLARLLHIVQDEVPVAFQPLTPPVDVVIESSSIQMLDMDASRELDGSVTNMDLQVTIPDVILDLKYEEAQHLILQVAELKTHLLMREFDFRAIVDLRTLSIEDSMRPSHQRYLAQTPLSEADNFVHVAYTKINNKKSPLYTSYEMDVNIEIAKLLLNCDRGTLLHLRPFYEVLLGKRFVAYSSTQLPTTQSLVLKDNEGVQENNRIAVLHSTPSGIHVNCSFKSISLELLRDVVEEGELESLVQLDIGDLRTEVFMPDLLEANVNIGSININDMCKARRMYYYKTIVCPEESEKQVDIITVKFKQTTKADSTVDICISNVKCYISLDSVFDTLNITLANLASVLQLVAPVDKDGTIKEHGEQQAPPVQGPAVDSSMHVTINVPNPSIMLLEDPTTANSKAIIGKCGVEFQYIKASKGTENTDTLMLSLNQTEIYVLMNMQKFVPQQILLPCMLKLYFSRRMEKEIVLLTKVNLDMESVTLRVSVNDLVMLQNIVGRRTVIQAPAPTENADAIAELQKEDTDDDESKATQVTNYTIRANIGEICLTTINDMHGKNLPLFRIILDGTTFEADGPVQYLRGQGSIITNIESYNSKLAYWEPVLDKNVLSLKVENNNDFNLSVISDELLQFTVTSSMLDMISQTYSSLMHPPTVERLNVAPITIYNQLDIPVELKDSVTREDIALIDSPDGMQFGNEISKYVDLSFGDILQDRTIKRLAVNMIKPRVCFLHPTKSSSNSGGPIAEELYENERYNPLTFSWSKPFLVGDPEHFTDATGSIKKSKKEAALPVGWEWQTEWAVDKHGKVGVDFDKDGFEYGMNFTQFGISNKRRDKQTMDCVRRRRWVRYRQPKQAADGPERIFTVCWDVRPHVDGSKLIYIRSHIQIFNDLPYDISIMLSDPHWKENVVLGPISPNSYFGIPLLYANAGKIAVKAHQLPYEFSTAIPCTLQSNDATVKHNVSCHEPNLDPLYINAVFKQVDKLLYISFHPYLTIKNLLPCVLKYRFSINSNFEEGTLLAGASVKAVHVLLMNNPKLFICLGNYNYSHSIDINSIHKKRMNITFQNDKNRPEIVVHVKFKSHGYCKEIIVFTKYVVVDRCLLDVSTRYKLSHNEEIIRKTYSETTVATTAHDAHEVAPPTTTVAISQLQVKSSHKYKVKQVDIGSAVYIDRPFHFIYLPQPFRGHSFISPANNDRLLKNDNMISFTVDKDCIVVLLLDKRVTVTPQWLSDLGFYKLIEQSISKGEYDGMMHMFHYAMYGRVYSANEAVVLGCNLSKNSRDMYSILVLPKLEAYQSIIDQVTFNNTSHHMEASNNWIYGANGLSLVYTESGKLQIGILKNRCFSDEIDVKVLSNAKAPFQVVDTRTNHAYQLVYSVQSMPGVFSRTNVVSVMCRYCIINCLDEPIEIRQKHSKVTSFVEPYSSEGWHKTDSTRGTNVQIRCENTHWCFGAIDINEVGNHVLLLPSCNDGAYPVVINVEVKLADPLDHCAVSVLIWQASSNGASTLSIRNDSNVPISVLQAEVNFSSGQSNYASLYEVCVSPGKWLPYGWADTDTNKQVLVAVGKSTQTSQRVATLSLKKHNSIRLPYDKTEEVVCEVVSYGNGRVLRIHNNSPILPRKPAAPSFKLNVTFSLIGISVVADKPRRYELLSLYLTEVATTLGVSSNVSTIELNVTDLQIDNYCETAIYPVLFSRVQKKVDPAEKADTKHFIQFSTACETVPGTPSTTKYNYLALRILEFAIEIDSATIQLIMSDFLQDFKVVSYEQSTALSQPEDYIQKFNTKLLSPQERLQHVDIYKALLSARQSKIYFDNIVLHPIKASLSFVHTEFPHRDEHTPLAILNVVASFAAVDRMEIKLNSFIVSDVIESYETLGSRIMAKKWNDLTGQLGAIAGSLAIIGSPVGLARNIGSGVQDFFYEPYQGLVQSPVDFIVGIGKGTSSLVTGVISGALNSTAAIVGSASSSISYLSGDADYIRERSQARQKLQASRGGVIAGIVGGGESVVTGIASGVTGIFTKPVEEAKKDGAKGFFRGLGMGVVGAAVKPVLGVTDGISTIAAGISNTVGDAYVGKRFRPPRTFVRSEHDPSERILCPINMSAIMSQEFVMEQAKHGGYEDNFVVEVPIDKGCCVVLSELYLFYKTSDGKVWKKAWAEISHCQYLDTNVGVHLYGKHQPRLLECRNASRAQGLYEVLYLNAFRMGNANNMMPIEMMQQGGGGPIASSESYQFGTANKKKIPATSYSDSIILDRAQKLLGDARDEAQLDAGLWQLIQEWDQNHSGLSASRACGVLIINKSKHAIQLSRAQVLQGKSLCIIGCPGYDKDSRSIGPGGAAVIFAYGYTPSLLEHGHVEISVVTGVFNAMLSTIKRHSHCEGRNNFSVGFLEKTVKDWWSKFVLVIYE